MNNKIQYSFPAVALLLLMLFPVYPQRLAIFTVSMDLFGTSTAVITFFSLIWLFFPERLAPAEKKLPWWMKTAMALFFLLTVWHLARNTGNTTANEVGQALSYLLIPVCAFIFFREMRTLLPWCGAALWLYSSLVSLHEYFIRDAGNALGGLALNKNWNASLITACAPFALLLIWRYMQQKRISACICTAAVAGISGFILRQCDSLGVFAAFPLTLGLCAYLMIPAEKLRTFIRKTALILFAVCSLGIIGYVYLYGMPEPVAHEMKGSIRVFFIKQTAGMIMDSPVRGHGLQNFEQKFLEWRTEDYFRTEYPADREPHPHNHLLFIAAGAGLAGLLAWLTLLLVPLWKFARKFRESDPECKTIFFACVLLFIHSMADLILYQEPVNILALLLLGTIWGEVFQDSKAETANQEMTDFQQKTAYSLLRCIGTVAVMLGTALIIANLYSSYQLQQGFRMRQQAEQQFTSGHPEKGLEYLKNAEEHFRNSVEYSAHTARDKFNCMDIVHHFIEKPDFMYASPTQKQEDLLYALHLCDRIRATSNPDMAHINQMEGQLLFKLAGISPDRDAVPGIIEEAAQLFLREAELYPLALEPVISICLAARVQGNPELAMAADAELRRRISTLKLDIQVETNPFRLTGSDSAGVITRDPAFDYLKNVRHK